MAVKATSEAQVLVYPQSAIPKLDTPGFSVYDRLGELLFPWSAGQSASFASINPSIAGTEWSAQPHFTGPLTGIQQVRFLRNGRVLFGITREENLSLAGPSSVAGYVIAPRVPLLDAQIGDNADMMDAGNTDQAWTALSGTWKTVLPTGEPRQTCILNTGSDALAVAQSAGSIAANRSAGFDVLFLSGIGAGTVPAAAFDIGDKWRIFLPHAGKPEVQKLDGGQWRTRRVFNDAPAINCHGGSYCVYIYRLAGRGVFEITAPGALPFTGDAFWWLDTTEPLEQYAGAGLTATPRAKEVTWPEAPLVATAFNVHARIGPRQVKWSDAGGTPYTANFTRRTVRYTDLGIDPVPQLVHWGGWEREGVSIGIAPAITDNALDYTCTLTASADGIDTPLVDKVVVKYAETWDSGSGGSLDLRPAVESIRVSLPLPTAASGATATVSLKHASLENLSGLSSYLQDYSPVKINVRWRYSDGSYSSWINIFSGYAAAPDATLEQVNGGTTELVCFDDNLRLRKPSGMVTHRHPPLDRVFMERAASAFVPVGEPFPNISLYSPECAQEIIRLFFGDNAASAINGDGNPLRFLPSGHPPLLSNTNDTAGYLAVSAAFGEATELPVLSSGNWLFPPPFGSDARSWIDQFAKTDRCVGAFMKLPDTAAPVFVFGRLLTILASRMAKRIPDADYIAGTDVNLLARRLGRMKKTENDVNRAAVWMNSTDGLEGMFPALRMAESTLPTGDAASERKTWTRLDITRTAFALVFAEDIANQIISELTGVRRIWPSMTFRGSAYALPGDVFRIVADGAQSDDILNLHNVYARAETIEHQISFDGHAGDFWTTAYCRPLSSSELAAQTAAGNSGGDNGGDEEYTEVSEI